MNIICENRGAKETDLVELVIILIEELEPSKMPAGVTGEKEFCAFWYEEWPATSTTETVFHPADFING
jgi:hypothetical protein